MIAAENYSMLLFGRPGCEVRFAAQADVYFGLSTAHVLYCFRRGGETVERLIMHVDVNSAFLSWEAATAV